MTFRGTLGELLAAAEVRVEQMLNAEAEAVGGDIAASRAWFELNGLRAKLRIAQSQAALIERLGCAQSTFVSVTVDDPPELHGAPSMGAQLDNEIGIFHAR